MTDHIMQSLPNPRFVLANALCLLAIGCSGGGNSTANADPDPVPVATVEESLAALGMSTTAEPRLDEYGNELPAGYSPRGQFWDLERTDELLVVARDAVIYRTPDRPETPFASWTINDNINDLPPLERLTDIQPAQGVYHGESLSSTPGNHLQHFTRRDAVMARPYSDPKPALVAAYFDQGQGQMRLEVKPFSGGANVQTPEPPMTTVDQPIAPAWAVTHVELVAVDLDDDPRDELAVAFSSAGMTTLMILDDAETSFVALHQEVFNLVLNAAVATQLKAGNLDHDPASELAFLMTERTGNDGRATWLVVDDYATDFATTDPRILAVDGTAARFASLELADVDSDGRDEILFAGKGAMSGADNYQLLAIDDLVAREHHDEWQELASQVTDLGQGRDYPGMRIDAFDTTGFGDLRILVNCAVFAFDLAKEQPWHLQSNYASSDPGSRTWGVDGSFHGVDGALHSAWLDQPGRPTAEPNGEDVMRPMFLDIAVGNFDERPGDEIAVYESYQGVGVTPAVIHSNSDNGYGFLTILHYDHDAEEGTPPLKWSSGYNRQFCNCFPSTTFINPILVPVNFDNDGVRVKFTGNSRTLFSEPVVDAVLASPPFYADAAQAPSTTSFGVTQSTSNSEETRMTSTWGASISNKVTASGEVFGIGVSVSRELTRKWGGSSTRIAGSAYGTATSITHTTGAGEDVVVFTSTPYDEYEYEVVAASAGSGFEVGDIQALSIPREPRQSAATLEFFNASVPERLRIGADVLGHRKGIPSSYPNEAERDQILAANGGGLFQSGGAVSQGSGSTTRAISLSNNTSAGNLEVESDEWSMSLTGEASWPGVSSSITVGGSAGSSEGLLIKRTIGAETSFSGTVGALSDPGFAPYSWGIFTYTHTSRSSGQVFPVIHYWVE